jgi:phosphoadenosine phosphosulfate reductase
MRQQDFYQTGVMPVGRPANLEQINARLEGQSPETVLRWAAATYGRDLALATGFGLTGVVLMHMMIQIRPSTTIFYLQTDLLFPETLALRDQLAQRFNIDFVEVHSGFSLDEQAHQYGRQLWQSSPDLCCHLRKVKPLRRYLAGKRAWIAGIRRDQSPTRADTAVVAWDNANNLVKLAPLASWTREQVHAYITAYELPYNQLHDVGYLSIGCMPCTLAVEPGETNERAGRWTDSDKTECGIHIQPDGTVVRLD